MTQSYEELVAELREIVKKIEDRDTPLEESIALYERGSAIIKQCEDLLQRAELRISKVSRD